MALSVQLVGPQARAGSMWGRRLWQPQDVLVRSGTHRPLTATQSHLKTVYHLAGTLRTTAETLMTPIKAPGVTKLMKLVGKHVTSLFVVSTFSQIKYLVKIAYCFKFASEDSSCSLAQNKTCIFDKPLNASVCLSEPSKVPALKCNNNVYLISMFWTCSFVGISW